MVNNVNAHQTGYLTQIKQTEIKSSKANNSISANKKSQLDQVNISAESLAMYDAQQSASSAANKLPYIRETLDANGNPIREIPEEYKQYLFRCTDFRIFAEKILAPHVDNANELMGNMEKTIFSPESTFNTELTLEERTMIRETILLEAKHIATTYLEGDDAQRFIDGIANLIFESEMQEKGYSMVINERDPNEVSFRRPFDEADRIAKNNFIQHHMTEEQKEHLEFLNEERSRLGDKLTDLARDEYGNMTIASWNALKDEHPELWAEFGEAVEAARNFVDEMAEYHNFQEKWDVWQVGDAPEDNWFVQAEYKFEANSLEVSDQLEEIRFDFRSQFNLNGMDGLRSFLELMMISNEDNKFWDWFMQLRVFNMEE